MGDPNFQSQPQYQQPPPAQYGNTYNNGAVWSSTNMPARLLFPRSSLAAVCIVLLLLQIQRARYAMLRMHAHRNARRSEVQRRRVGMSANLLIDTRWGGALNY
jgi:hypothetical protein